MSQMLWETTQKARSEYFCDYCFQWIVPGETYRRWVWKPGGRTFIVMRQHEHPGCNYEEFYEQNQDCALVIPITYQIVQRQVEVVLRNGQTVTEYHPEYVPVIEMTVQPISTDEEIPF